MANTHITNVEDAVEHLRPRLQDYLEIMLDRKIPRRGKFACYVHDDGQTPNMNITPNENGELVHCFSCGVTHNIFQAAAFLEHLPENGPHWIRETIPTLCERLGIKYQPAALSPTEKERIKLRKLAADITDIIRREGDTTGYAGERNWINSQMDMGTLDTNDLIGELSDMGWRSSDLNSSKLIETSGGQEFFGPKKLTIAIKDYRGRPIAFMYRRLDDKKPKYMNTPESSIYNKSKELLGLDVALKGARSKGLIIVEGPGDLAQLYRLGITNAASTCGTSLTPSHLSRLKSLGINKVILCFDWDKAGVKATNRFIERILPESPGLACEIILSPEEDVTDLDELLCETTHNDQSPWDELPRVSAFQWQLDSFSEHTSIEHMCDQLVPVIAGEPTAVRREMLIKQLSDKTSISFSSLLTDVMSIRNQEFQERRQRLKAAAEEFMRDIEHDPDSAPALLAQTEKRIEEIDKTYNSDNIGTTYQLSRIQAIDDLNRRLAETDEAMGFKMDWFRGFSDALTDSSVWAHDALLYFGGRANSGKTATMVAMAVDILLSDENALVLAHFTDDSLRKVLPRFKANIARMLFHTGQKYTIAMAANPYLHIPEDNPYLQNVDKIVNEYLTEWLSTEKLTLLDDMDGKTLSTLEKHLRHLRKRHPDQKVLCVCDNTYNYRDWGHLDPRQRMANISDGQKTMMSRYRATMFATVEYRKNMPQDPSKMRLPRNEDLADAREMTYRPDAIIHVYNDLADRREHATIFWRDESQDPGKRLPRLRFIVGKNKISGFKDELVADLDPDTVTLHMADLEAAEEAADAFQRDVEAGNVQVDGDRIVINTDYSREDDI